MTQRPEPGEPAYFTAGDAIPAWIMRAEPEGVARLTFGQDVEVHTQPDGPHVYPRHAPVSVQHAYANPLDLLNGENPVATYLGSDEPLIRIEAAPGVPPPYPPVEVIGPVHLSTVPYGYQREAWEALLPQRATLA